VQLLMLIDQLYVNHAAGEWHSPKKLKSVIRQCHQLAHAVEVYRHGSLTSEEISYVYGVLCYVALHGCNDEKWSMQFGQTAMQHTMELRGGASHETNVRPSSSSSCPTPLSSALLFALIGSGLLFDAFVYSYDKSVKLYDEKLANKYREWCLEVMKMQKHLAQTIPIAKAYLCYSKVRSFRAVDRMKSSSNRDHQIEEARKIAQKYGMKVIECSIDFEETLLRWISEEEDTAKRLTIKESVKREAEMSSSQKYSSKSETRHDLDVIITRFKRMGDKASAKRAKKLLQSMMGYSTEDEVENVHNVVQFGDDDSWKV